MAKVYHPHAAGPWWNRRWPYRIFLLRELSAVFFAIYMVVFLLLVDRVRSGPVEFADFLDVLQNPLMIALHVVVLAFALLHTVTWFQAVPKAMVLKRGDMRVPATAMIAGVYGAWAAASIVVLIIFLA